MPFWTIEEVADALGMTVAQVYETRRRKEYPGNLGRLRGRRLLFPVDLVQAGPQVPETTEDVSEAILWTLQGIEEKIGKILIRLNSVKVEEFTLDEVAERMHQIADDLAAANPWTKDFYPTTTTTGDEEEE